MNTEQPTNAKLSTWRDPLRRNLTQRNNSYKRMHTAHQRQKALSQTCFLKFGVTLRLCSQPGCLERQESWDTEKIEKYSNNLSIAEFRSRITSNSKDFSEALHKICVRFKTFMCILSDTNSPAFLWKRWSRGADDVKASCVRFESREKRLNHRWCNDAGIFVSSRFTSKLIIANATICPRKRRWII